MTTPDAGLATDLRSIFDATCAPGEDFAIWRDRVIHLTRMRLAHEVVGSCWHGDPENVPCLPCWSIATIVRGGTA